MLEIIRDGLRTDTAINLDEADLKTREKRIAGGTSSVLRRVARRPLIIDDFIALVAQLERITAKLDAPLRGREWSEWVASIVSRFKLESKRDLLAACAVDEVAALFERADRMNVRFDAGAIIDALEQQTIKADEAPRVWIGDVMQFRGRTFEHVFAVRMQDDSFPQRRIEDPLLPEKLVRWATCRKRRPLQSRLNCVA